jgi:hypothetical protein
VGGDGDVNDHRQAELKLPWVVHVAVAVNAHVNA